MKYEIFHPTDGKPIRKVPWKWLAWLLVRTRYKYCDYAKQGEGWL